MRAMVLTAARQAAQASQGFTRFVLAPARRLAALRTVSKDVIRLEALAPWAARV